MSTATKSGSVDANVWEKITDGFSAFAEWFTTSLTSVMGSSNERYVRSLGYVRNKAKGEHTVTPGSMLARSTSLNRKCRR